jgi:transcriptional regulator with XRE-family HTH domain
MCKVQQVESASMHEGEKTMGNQSEQDGRRQFGRTVRYWMEKQGCAPEGLAKKTGYSIRNIQEILYGQVVLTRAEKVKFARALNLRPSEGRSQRDPYSDLPDDALDALFLAGVPEDEPRLPILYKF